MILYIIYNADLLEIPDNEAKEDAVGYVDDIAMIATGENFNETTANLRYMMTKNQGGMQWSRDHNSRFEVTKSVVMHFTRKTRKDPEDNHRRIPVEAPDLILENQIVKEVNCFKYLGIQIDAQLRWKEQAQRATANATKWLLQFRHLTRPTTGIKSKLMRQMYLAVALPKITYGTDVWYTPPSKPAGATKNMGSVGALRNLQKTQRIASIAITGTLRTAPTDLLDAHAGLLPMDLALKKVCHRAITRMLTLPEAHPLHRPIQQAQRNPPTKHLSPINSLLKTFRMEEVELETITPISSNGNAPSQYTTKIAKTREDSILYESQDTADYKIFSDGSGHDDGIGAAAILYRKGRATPVKSLKIYLGSPTKHNTFEAEVMAEPDHQRISRALAEPAVT